MKSKLSQLGQPIGQPTAGRLLRLAKNALISAIFATISAAIPAVIPAANFVAIASNFGGNLAIAQAPPSAAFPATGGSGVSGPGISGTGTVPSLEQPSAAAPPASASVPASSGATAATGVRSRTKQISPGTLPNDKGQYWEEYDLRPYTNALKDVAKPQQAVVDWILRETGTDVWFSEPFGFLNADRNTLRVYHTPEMHQIVRSICDRFVQGAAEKQVISLRMVTISSPNWRTRAHPLMKSVQAQSPGVDAWLVSKENASLLMAMLRGRPDFRELQAGDLPLHNGQSQVIEQLRSRNYVRDLQRMENGWPSYLPLTVDFQEGYRLELSPLLSVDRKTVDVVLKCNIDQLEKLVNVNIDLPVGVGQVQTAQINVPQISSWRLHERFRWPTDQILVLSCGVVAAPVASANNTLLGQSGSFRGLISGANAERADALLFIQYKGDASTMISPSKPMAQQALTPSVSRGRY